MLPYLVRAVGLQGYSVEKYQSFLIDRLAKKTDHPYLEKGQRSLYSYLHKETDAESKETLQASQERVNVAVASTRSRGLFTEGLTKVQAEQQKDYDLVNIRRRIKELEMANGGEEDLDDSTPKITFLECIDTQDQPQDRTPNDDINLIELEYERPIVVMKTSRSAANRGEDEQADDSLSDEGYYCPNLEGISRSRLAEVSDRMEIKVEENPDPVPLR
jgi:hypothetical protein